MLRISKRALSNGTQTLVVEGRLMGPWVAELQRAVAETGAVAAVDLTGLSFADAEGVAALQALGRAGTTLAGASGFLAALMGVDGGGEKHAG